MAQVYNWQLVATEVDNYEITSYNLKFVKIQYKKYKKYKDTTNKKMQQIKIRQIQI